MGYASVRPTFRLNASMQFWFKCSGFRQILHLVMNSHEHLLDSEEIGDWHLRQRLFIDYRGWFGINGIWRQFEQYDILLNK